MGIQKNKSHKGTFRVSFAEVMVNFSSNGLVLAPPSDLKSRRKTSIRGKALANLCHVYFVIRRPGLQFVPETISSKNKKIFGMISIAKNGYKESVEFEVPHLGRSLRWTVSEFPHRLIESELVFPSHRESLPAYIVPSLGRIAHADAHKAEVLYIGQSFGDGQRTVLDRLSDHSTLQRVLADINYHTPDQDVLLLLVEYAGPKIHLLIPPESTYPKDFKVDDEKIDKTINQKLDQIPFLNLIKNNQVSIIEAALINYFKPVYNEKFVHQPPQSSHQHLVECYNEDFSALTVEINTEDAQIELYSNARPAGVHHLASFNLHDPEKRKSFFRLLAFDSEVGLVQSGPIVPPQSLKSGRFATLGW